MKTYFVSYNFFLLDGRQGVANMETGINGCITCLADVTAIEQKVLADHPDYKTVIINNYIEFPK